MGKFDGVTGDAKPPAVGAVMICGVVPWPLLGNTSGAYVEVIVNSIKLDEESWCAGNVAAPAAELFATLFLVSIPVKRPLLNSRDLAKEVIACSFLVFPLISTLAALTLISVT